MRGSSRFQHGTIERVENKTAPATWFLRFYQTVGGKRVHRRHRIGSVREFPRKSDAERAVQPFRAALNSETRIPETVNDLIAHYQRLELTPERKAYSSIQNHKILAALYIAPRWGEKKLSDVRTVQVEEWLDSLSLAPGSKTKIKSAFSVMYSHAIRHEWLTFNPISKVRTSSIILREKDVLSPTEFQALLAELSVRDRAIVLLAGSTGLRRSEFIALKWQDLNVFTMEVSVTKSCFRNRIGKTKTRASARPVPLHPLVLEALLAWKGQSHFGREEDFLFASLRKNGAKPLSPDSLLTRSIKPALVRAGIVGKVIGWHNFRHSLATNLRALGVDIKVAQDLLRHSNSRTTLDFYTRAVSQQKRDANHLIVGILLPGSTHESKDDPIAA